MWPFPSSEPSETLQVASDPVLLRHNLLADRVSDLEKSLKLLKLEWEGVFEKQMAVVQRLNKRARDALQAEQSSSEAEAESDNHQSGSAPLSLRDRVLLRRGHRHKLSSGG